MPQNPPKGLSRITPYLYYNNVDAALDWLVNTFGFSRGEEITNANGQIIHAEMSFKGGAIMMGPPSDEKGSKSPKELSGVNQSLYIYVENIDEHYQQSSNAGATITAEPTDMFWGDRMYKAQDLEGHFWQFAENIEDISPEDMQPTLT